MLGVVGAHLNSYIKQRADQIIWQLKVGIVPSLYWKAHP